MTSRYARRPLDVNCIVRPGQNLKLAMHQPALSRLHTCRGGRLVSDAEHNVVDATTYQTEEGPQEVLRRLPHAQKGFIFYSHTAPAGKAVADDDNISNRTSITTRFCTRPALPQATQTATAAQSMGSPHIILHDSSWFDASLVASSHLARSEPA